MYVHSTSLFLLQKVKVIRLKTCGFLPLYLNPVVFGFPENICAGGVRLPKSPTAPLAEGSLRGADFFLF